ncbi:hypothetical protein EJB05_09533, partial [Eragrostis curvula]
MTTPRQHAPGQGLETSVAACRSRVDPLCVSRKTKVRRLRIGFHGFPGTAPWIAHKSQRRERGMSGAELFIGEDLGLSDTQVEVLARSIHQRPTYVLGRRGTTRSCWLTPSSWPARSPCVSVEATPRSGPLGSFPASDADSPVSSRRFTITTTRYISVNVGILLAFVPNYAFAGMPAHLGTGGMYVISVLPPLFLAAAVLAMPESPRWLVLRGRHAEARVHFAGGKPAWPATPPCRAPSSPSEWSRRDSSSWPRSPPTASAGARSSSIALALRVCATAACVIMGLASVAAFSGRWCRFDAQRRDYQDHQPSQTDMPQTKTPI